MTLDEIRTFAKATPFKPFEVVLVDGRTFEVRHPDFIFIPPGRGTWVYIVPPKGSAAEHINTVVISSIRHIEPKGKRRRKAG